MNTVPNPHEQFMDATTRSIEALILTGEAQNKILENLAKRLASLEARVQSQDEELAALNTIVTDLMHKVYSSDTDVRMG